MQQNNELLLISGPCVIEDEGLCLEIAQELVRQFDGLPINYYFKASFDKANRTSIDGFRGPGLKAGLKILENVKAKTGLKLCTDIHESNQAEAISEVIDFIQIPAFLCRQTDLVVSAATAAIQKNRKLNIKKGQFLAPWDTKNIVSKVKAVSEKVSDTRPLSEWLYLCERGTSFGYNTLVVDMTSFQEMQKFGVPTIFDATHSVQQPGAGSGGSSTGGKRENIEVLARAAIAAGADGLFMETHPRPALAKSDGPNAFPLEHMGEFLKQLLAIRKVTQGFSKLVQN